MLRGHDDWVHSAAYSPDGSRIVTASNDETARIWNAANGKEIASLRWHAKGVNCAAFSPDSRRIVTVGDDGTARIWDAATAEQVVVIRAYESPARSSVFSPDGTRILTTSGRTAGIFEAATGKAIAVLGGHKGVVWSAAFSPDGTRIVTASGNFDTPTDNMAHIWDAATRKELVVLRGQEATSALPVSARMGHASSRRRRTRPRVSGMPQPGRRSPSCAARNY